MLGFFGFATTCSIDEVSQALVWIAVDLLSRLNFEALGVQSIAVRPCPRGTKGDQGDHGGVIVFNVRVRCSSLILSPIFTVF